MKDGDSKMSLSKDEREFLNQAVSSLYEAEVKLEESYNKKNPNQFNAVKKFMLKVNERVEEIL